MTMPNSASLGIGPEPHGVSQARAPRLSMRMRKSKAMVSPIKEDNDDEVAVSGLIEYLEKQVLSKATARGLIVFLFTIIALTVLLAIHRFDGYYNDGYITVHIMREFLDPEVFQSIKTEDDFYEWIMPVMTSLWEGVTFNHDNFFTAKVNIPLHFLVVKQLRVNTIPCDLDRVLNTFSQDTVENHLPTACAPRYKKKYASVAPFGTENVTWIPNTSRPAWLRGSNIDGDLFTYTDTEFCFAVEFNFSAPLEEAKAAMRTLRDNHWIDTQTRVVVVEIILFSPGLNTYALSQLVMEITEVGYVITNISTKTMYLKHWQFETSLSYVAVILDVCICLGMIHVSVSLILSWWKKKKAGKNSVNLLEIFVVMSVLSFIITYYYRVQMWVLANQLVGTRAEFEATHKEEIDKKYAGNVDFYRWDWMMHAIDIYDHMWLWYSFATALAVVRLFDYLKYTSRLNVLSNTLKHAFPFLLSLGLIFTMVVVGFSYFAHILYGHHIDEFRTLAHSIGTLLYFLTGEMDHFPKMIEVHQDISTFFVLCYMVLAWVILLNLVLAVLAGSFAIVKEARDNPQWDVRHLTHDVQNNLSKVFRCVPRSKWLHINKEGVPSETAQDVLQRVRKEYSSGKQTNNEAYISLKKFSEIGHGQLSQAQLAWAFEQTRSQFAGAGRDKGLTAGLQHQLDVIRFEVTKMGQSMHEVIKKSLETHEDVLDMTEEAFEHIQDTYQEVQATRQDIQCLSEDQKQIRKDVRKSRAGGPYDMMKMGTEVEALKTMTSLYQHVQTIQQDLGDFNLRLETVANIVSAPLFGGVSKPTELSLGEFVCDVPQIIGDDKVIYDAMSDPKAVRVQKKRELMQKAAEMEGAIGELQSMIHDLQNVNLEQLAGHTLSAALQTNSPPPTPPARHLLRDPQLPRSHKSNKPQKAPSVEAQHMSLLQHRLQDIEQQIEQEANQIRTNVQQQVPQHPNERLMTEEQINEWIYHNNSNNNMGSTPPPLPYRDTNTNNALAPPQLQIEPLTGTNWPTDETNSGKPALPLPEYGYK